MPITSHFWHEALASRLAGLGLAIQPTRLKNRMAITGESVNIFTMPTSEKLDDFVRQIGDLLPEDLRQTRQDIQKNLKAGLSSTLSRMDLVTREEFDIQTELLARSRALLEELEHRVEELEARLKQEL